MKKIDITGKKFGRLLVIKENGHTDYGNILWLCKCDCGNEISTVAQNLKKINGGTKSCGCLNKELIKKRNLERAENKIGICEWCKKPFSFKTSLHNKKTCSKECKRKYDLELIRKRGKRDFKHILMLLLNSAKTRAKSKKQEFDLDLEYLLTLFNSNGGRCNVTNIKFVISTKKGNKQRSPWSVSLDRIDSSRGYIKNNVQLVCLMYNLCKSHWCQSEVVEFATALLSKEMK